MKDVTMRSDELIHRLAPRMVANFPIEWKRLDHVDKRVNIPLKAYSILLVLPIAALAFRYGITLAQVPLC